MWKLFKKEQAVQIDVMKVAFQMQERYWDCEVLSESKVAVYGNYRNLGKSFKRLILNFKGEEVFVQDERGNFITGITPVVPANDMYPTIKNVLNVF